jgi:uncharacterized cupin superfamily protein
MSATTCTPIVSIHGLALQPRPAAWQPPPDAKRRFAVSRARIAPMLGLSKLGCTLHEVPPGATAYPFHSHRANEELLFVLAGHGELRFGSATHPAREGDLIGCPTGGPETAHQLINTGNVPLRYLAMSTMIDPDICEYPDSGKVGAYAGDGDGELMHLSQYGSAIDYWKGE